MLVTFGVANGSVSYTHLDVYKRQVLFSLIHHFLSVYIILSVNCKLFVAVSTLLRAAVMQCRQQM